MYLIAQDAPANLLDAVRTRQAKDTLAAAFVAVLGEWLTEDELSEVRVRNTTYGEGVCASHDFCDANMAMLEAWQRTFKTEPAFLHCDTDETSLRLWGEAWDIAKRDRLTGRPD